MWNFNPEDDNVRINSVLGEGTIFCAVPPALWFILLSILPGIASRAEILKASSP